MTAPIESNIFLCACACSGSVFLNNSAISYIFLNSAHMPKQLDYRVAALKPQVANAYWGNQCSSMEYCLKLPNMVRTFWL